MAFENRVNLATWMVATLIEGGTWGSIDVQFFASFE
jgi:hypothetical protein